MADLAAELSAASARLGRSMHPRTAANLAESRTRHEHGTTATSSKGTTRAHATSSAARPAPDVERGRRRRNLPILKPLVHEPRSRLKWIAAGCYRQLPEPASIDFIRWLHREFYRDVPDAMLRITGAGRDFTMRPGEWRTRTEHDVAVGRHVPPSSDHVDEFMQLFADRYRFDRIGKAGRIIAMAAAHHRFNYIHPFPDGNGRVSRLMSHGMAWSATSAAQGLWSVSRGLARGLDSRYIDPAYRGLVLRNRLVSCRTPRMQSRPRMSVWSRP